MSQKPPPVSETTEVTSSLSVDRAPGGDTQRAEATPNGDHRLVSGGSTTRSVAPGAVRPKAPRRNPTARLPRADRRFGVGMVWAVALHGLVAALAFVFAGRALDSYEKSLGEPGLLGGGGGGGGAAQVQYIELPPLPSPARRAPQPKPPVQAAPPPPVVEPPTPEVKEVAPEIPQITSVPQEIPPVNVETLGVGSGIGVGAGAGSGTGGGIGSGRGAGIGAGEGTGTGGEGGAVLAPEVRVVVFPFEDPPAELRGTEVKARFWVDARGRVTKVEIEPAIPDASFRKKLLERLEEWTFYPARTVDGRPVAGQVVVSIPY